MFVPEPWQVPTLDGVQRPVSHQVSVDIPQGADDVVTAALMQDAAKIVNGNHTQVQHWMNGLRQQVSLSGSPYVDRELSMPGMSARYRFNQGQEKLNITVKPAQVGGGGSQTSETNLDGYICWIHVDPKYPDTVNNKPGFPGPYNLFFNGYLIEQNYQPIGPVGGYPILFGRTALLCSSYVGSVEKENPLVNGGSFKLPNTMIPPNGWGSYKNGAAPDGSNQPTITKTLGYWIFDWTNEHNPWQYIPFGFPGPYENWSQFMSGSTGSVQPQFNKGMYFKNASKSPLAPKGQNGVSATLSPVAKGPEEVRICEIFLAEFYDRGNYRHVSQSWTYSNQAGRIVLVNDSPLIYGGCNNTGGFSPGGGVKFDLTPSVTKNFSGSNVTDTTNSGLMGPHDGLINIASDNLAGLNANQLAQYHAWEQQVIAVNSAWQAQIASQLAALLVQITAQAPLYNNAYKAAMLARFIKADVMLYETFFNDYTQFYNDPNNPPPIVYTNPVQDDKTALVVQSITTHVGTQTTVSETFGPMQEYYLDLTPSFIDFVINLHNPLVISEKPLYIPVPGSEYEIDEPNVTISGLAYEQDSTYSFLVSHNNYVGPAQPSVLIELLDGYINTNVTKYISLLNQYQALLNSTPPNAPPMPDLGKDLSDFDHSNISIAGDQWSYTQ